jgi:hypothetical protein
LKIEEQDIEKIKKMLKNGILLIVVSSKKKLKI